MKFTLILGFPRSGTSFVCSIIEKLGLDFNIEDSNNMDNMYKCTHGFNQRRDIHVLLALSGVENMKTCKKSVPLDLFISNKSRAIKEPYLLYILDQIREFVLNIVLVIRNPNEVMDSLDKFYKDNLSANKKKIDDWNNYYKIFKNSVGNIPYTVVNYNELIKNPTNEINNLKSFLGSDFDIKPIIRERLNKTNYYLPVDTMYIYYCVINKIPIDNIDISTNMKCFCKSGKKYKKCCASMFHKN